MQFNEIITAISPMFLRHGFSVTESRSDYLKFESDSVTFTISQDTRENSISAYAGHRNGFLSLVNSAEVMKDVFSEDLNLYKDRNFLDNLIQFLQGGGSPILKGDTEILNKLEVHTNLKAKEYTERIMQEQKLGLADRAWDKKDYSDFIRWISQTNINSLPSIYKKKYEIAKSKI